MDHFLELLAALQNPGEEGPAPTIYDDLTQEYTNTTEGAAAKVAELEAALAEAGEKLQKVMAHNYELLMGNPAEATVEETNQNEATEEDDSSLDDLITYA